MPPKVEALNVSLLSGSFSSPRRQGNSGFGSVGLQHGAAPLAKVAAAETLTTTASVCFRRDVSLQTESG